MKIIRLETFVIGDGPQIDPDKGAIEPMACLRVHTDQGISGLSEVFRVPPGVVQAVVGGPDTHFGRLLIGQELTHPERLWDRMWNALMHTNRRGWQIIILGALDVALWDIYGKMLGQPVYKLLGGAERGFFQTHSDTPVEHAVPYCTLVSDTWDDDAMVRQQADRAARLAERGYRAFKVEPMMSSPRRVIELARTVREVIGADRTLMVDVGYGFNDVATTARISRDLEPYDVYFLETPLPVDNPEVYAALAARSAIPLAMGEHGVTRWEFREMIERGGVQIVQPYITTCGGFTEAKRIADMARERGVLVCPGNWSTQLLGAASVHLAAYSPVTPFIEFAPAEVFDSPLRLALQEQGFPVENGVIRFPDRPGVGYDLLDDIIEKYCF